MTLLLEMMVIMVRPANMFDQHYTMEEWILRGVLRELSACSDMMCGKTMHSVKREVLTQGI